MTQPPLSRQIQKLERTIGVQLFERDNRRVELTPAGVVFLGEAQRLLALAAGAPDLARRISDGSAGTVRIGFTAASTYGVLSDVLNHLGSELPDVDLELYEMVTREQVAALAVHELDLSLARPPFDTEAFGSRLLKREGLVVAVPSGHPFTGLDRPLTPEEVGAERLIMHSAVKARYFHDLVVRLVPIDQENIVHTVSQVLTMVWLVSAGRGIALVPESARRLGIEGVVYLPLAGTEDRPVELHLLWRKDSRNAALWQALERLKDLPA